MASRSDMIAGPGRVSCWIIDDRSAINNSIVPHPGAAVEGQWFISFSFISLTLFFFFLFCFVTTLPVFFWLQRPRRTDRYVFTGFHSFLLGFTGFGLVLLGFTGFYWVLLGFFSRSPNGSKFGSWTPPGAPVFSAPPVSTPISTPTSRPAAVAASRRCLGRRRPRRRRRRRRRPQPAPVLRNGAPVSSASASRRWRHRRRSEPSRRFPCPPAFCQKQKKN